MEEPTSIAAGLVDSMDMSTPDQVDNDMVEGGMDEGQMIAAEDAMAAMKAGDAEAFARALKAFMDMM
jgi:hypothetical protein